MKQPDTFHKCDLNGYACVADIDTDDNDDDNDDNDDDYNNYNNNPVGPIFAAIQKQQAKKTARLSKNDISGR